MSVATERAGWEAALDELESTLDAVERLLSGDEAEEQSDDVPPWTPPVTAGPLPVDLAPRAQDLHRRQGALISRTVSATVGVRQKLALLGKLTGLDDARRPDTAAYVDLQA